MKRIIRQHLLIILTLILSLPLKASNPYLVKRGIDRIAEPQFQNLLANKRIGILAHFASTNHMLRHLVDILHSDMKMEVVAIFAPEHGFRSHDDDWVEDGRDPQTNLPIYSLYKQNHQAPSMEQLKNIDLMIIDLKDVGMRFYTYSITVAKTMMACQENNIPVIILDRPNPLGGIKVEGVILEEHLRGWPAAYYPMPIRHGLTMGELATYYNNFFNINAQLTVIPILNWKREMIWDDTGLDWRSPSPALPSAKQSYFYAILGALESLNLAVGRGQTNEHAFEYFGAPWIDKEESILLCQRLTNENFQQIQFSPITWKITRSIYNNQIANGCKVSINDFRFVHGYKVLLKTISIMSEILGSRLELTTLTEKFIGATWIVKELQKGIDVDTIIDRINSSNEFEEFLKNRKEILLY